VDSRDLQADLGELAGLVVHQRDQRTDDQRRSAASDGRKLVAERFSRSGGHDEQSVASVGGGSADSLLIGAEGGKAEGGMKQAGEIGHAALSSFA
jgi:hypothetical protein